MDLSSPALKQIKVTVQGDWGSERHSDWHGSATAEEPMVAVVFLTFAGREVAWCKSEPSGVWLAKHESGWERAGLGSTVPVRLALFWYDNVGKDVQVNFSAGGGGRRGRILIPWAGYRPSIERGPYETGRACLFARIDSDPPVDCHVLFLASQQIRVGRAGRWRVRENVAKSLEPPLRTILTRAITGTFEAG